MNHLSVLVSLMKEKIVFILKKCHFLRKKEKKRFFASLTKKAQLKYKTIYFMRTANLPNGTFLIFCLFPVKNLEKSYFDVHKNKL
jgi:hypothetical protein